jgi:thermitase
MVTPNDPLYLRSPQFPNSPNGQWGLRRIDPERGWQSVVNLPRPVVTIAMIDSGVNPHQDLIGKVLFNSAYNAITNTFGPTADVADRLDHGTYTAGNAAARTNNLLGIAGTSFNSAFVLPIKVVVDGNTQEQVAPADLARAIDFAWRSGARVINMSVTQGDPNFAAPVNPRYVFFPEVQAAINRAWNAGAVLVAMAGNDGEMPERAGQVAFPAAYNFVIAVSAIDEQNNRLSFSNFGPRTTVAAPGNNILATSGSSNTEYRIDSGTSIATSFVGGLAAMLFAVNPQLTNSDVVQIIAFTAQQPRAGLPRFTNDFGFGVINVSRAIEIARRIRRP